MGFAHRIARLEDLPQIVAIYNSTIPSRQVTADIEPVSTSSRHPWFAQHDPARRPLWVAEEAGQIIGWLSFSDFYGRPAYAGTSELSIYIAGSHRRRGLGAYFLQQAITAAPRLRVHTLLGFIFGHNAPSLRLFERFSFQRWGLLPRVATLDGVERDLAILGRRLD
ncbi:phosphinothricin acetyltransferase [Noviherbaspirillum humi]|uniref:Phosphinothricin acetyltransferase n=1 Tax=Noviherbaspirillum humi TaxID=1688639 RepID=A0A239HBE8_9BURK|nr:GNAT family N-acetyltransferase [Noviherbaspirillum humi]SNS78602.1 phosphinothricin acetyltransferase [Noviherbaspirillum humi]